MECKNCGKQNTNDSNYCYSCGFKILKKLKKNKTSIKTTEIANKNTSSLWCCEYCHEEFDTKTEAINHEIECESNSKTSETGTVEKQKKSGWTWWQNVLIFFFALLLGTFILGLFTGQ